MFTQILLSTAFLLLVLWLSLRVPLSAPGEKPRQAFFGIPAAAPFLVLLAAGLVLRLMLGYAINGFDGDIACFKAWAIYTHEVGFQNMYYSDFFLDYPPGYLYMLWLTEMFRRLFSIPDYSQSFTLLIKMVPILSDLGCTAVLWALSRRRLGEHSALFVSAAYLFCPAVIINSAVWGQADSFCALLLLCTLLLLWNDRIPAAALMYGLGILSKPQLLIFAPALIFWVVRKKKWIHLLLGPALALAVILLCGAPFVQNWDFMKLLEIYTGTIDYYAYYTVNAYNIWALFGMNWRHLPENSTWLQFGVLIATALAGVLLVKSKKDEALFACPTVLMFTVYMLCIKMHERYLFPVLLCMLLTYVFTREKRWLVCFAATSFFHFLNVSYILHLNNAYVSPTAPQVILLSLMHVLCYAYTLYLTYITFLSKKSPKSRTWQPLSAPKQAEAPLPAAPAAPENTAGRRMTATDLILAGTVTAVYAVFAFLNLGGTEMPATTWTPGSGQSVIFSTEEAYSEIFYLPAVAPDDAGTRPRAGHAFLVEVSDDGDNWAVAADITAGSVYAWGQAPVMATGKYIRITPTCSDLALNEFALKRASGNGFAVLTAVSGDAWQLTDEQNLVPLFESCMNSSYFDEIYHARTAYEHILRLEPYENTHPPLGKLIISLGIRMFGMNPFGWRCMGALFGVLMLPVLYHLLKRLFASTWLSAAGTLLFAFDFMHYVQTRIATIDTYAVFFLLLMYDAMVIFLQTDLLQAKWNRILPPLFFSGLFMGLGIASKWTVAYGACGLAVLFFGKLILTYRSLPAARRGGLQIPYRNKALITCLWCCLFFVVIPFTLYYLSFLPITTLPHNSYDVWGRFWSYQTHMYNYHANLDATHSFQSPWYQWPFDVRNVWYYGNYSADGTDAVRTISVLGSPLFWWATVPALLYAFVHAVKKRETVSVVIVVGFLSVILPWVPIERCTFIYHYFTAVPFLTAALLLGFRTLSETKPLRKTVWQGEVFGTKRTVTLFHILLFGFLLLHLVLFGLFYPVLTGTQTARAYADALEWLPTWHFI